MVLAEDQSVIIKNGEARDLIVTCTYNGTFCDSTMNGNVTIVAPNGSVIINNAIMTKVNSVYNYTLNENQTLLNGDYLFVPTFYSGAISFSDSLIFTVTPSGTEPSIGETIIYSILFVFVIIMMIGLFLWGLEMNPNNSYNLENGKLFKLNYGKYFKVFLFCMSYFAFLCAMFLTWQISLNILWLSFTSDILKTFFLIIVGVTFPIGLVLFFMILFKWTYDDFQEISFASKGLRYNRK